MIPMPSIRTLCDSYIDALQGVLTLPGSSVELQTLPERLGPRAIPTIGGPKDHINIGI